MRSISFKILLSVFLLIAISYRVLADDNSPYIYVLGVAQDAGYPQSGCYKPHCMPGWNDPGLKKGAVSVGLIDPAAGKKYMFDATPNFPDQLYTLDVEAPDEDFELAGIFLTHAHIGHYTGLMFLGHEVMGAHDVPVYAMPRMSDYLTNNGPWSQLVAYRNIVLQPLQNGRSESLGQLRVTPFLVPHRDEYSETVGYRIEGPNKSALFIPDIDKWSAWSTDIADLVKTVDYALLDASFYADGELPGRDMSKIRHPYVVESMKALENLTPGERTKILFIHMNHSNPLLDEQSDERKLVESEGYRVAVKGLRLPM